MKDIPEAEKFIKEAKKAKDNKPKVSDVVTVGYGVYILDSFEDLRREDVPGNAITQYVML